MNKVILMGNLGADPDMRYMPSGSAVVTISVATSRTWKDKETDEKKEETSWHRCVAFGKQAEVIAEHFTKGRKILIEGRLKYGKYEKDDVTHYTCDVNIERFEFVEKRQGGGRPHPADAQDQDGMPPQSRAAADDAAPLPPDEFDDDIPFAWAVWLPVGVILGTLGQVPFA